MSKANSQQVDARHAASITHQVTQRQQVDNKSKW